MPATKAEIIRINSPDEVPCSHWLEPKRSYRWNAPASDGKEIWYRLYGIKVDKNPYVYLRTVGRVGPIYEVDNVIEEFNRALFEHCRLHEVPSTTFGYDTLFFSRPTAYSREAMSLPFPCDRTLEHAPATPGIYSRQLVETLQRGFFAKNPLWRVEICESDRDNDYSIFIYSNAVCISGDRYLGCGADAPYDRWQAAARKRREESYLGEQERMVRFAVDQFRIRGMHFGPDERHAEPLFWQTMIAGHSRLWVAHRNTGMLRAMIGGEPSKLNYFVTVVDGISYSRFDAPKDVESLDLIGTIGDEDRFRATLTPVGLPTTSIEELRRQWPSAFF